LLAGKISWIQRADKDVVWGSMLDFRTKGSLRDLHSLKDPPTQAARGPTPPKRERRGASISIGLA